MSNKKSLARKRIMRDLKELHLSEIPSISAIPLKKNIFEFHVNIKPTTGVYSGVYFHLIMTFPHNYPDLPPKIKICTPIKHPNIFNSFLCLSMLRNYTTNDAYEGWSSAYTITSILMQLQSFLFAEKVDQDGGYAVNAQLSDKDVKHSIELCKAYKCKTCGHSHNNPIPKVKGPKKSLLKVIPLDKQVEVLNASCQTTHTYWVGAYGNFGCNYGKVMYEVFINWTGDTWAKNNIRGGLCRFGWGTEKASVCGRDIHSFGYGGTGMFSFANNFTKFGESFTKNDTITCAINFENGRIYFAKNGKLMEPYNDMYVPDTIWNNGSTLYPLLSFKNSRAEFNFSTPLKPVKWLINEGFKTLEQIALSQGETADDDEKDSEMEENMEGQSKKVNWIGSKFIIDPIWVKIFESINFYDCYQCVAVCKKFNKIIKTYNILERNDMKCFKTKQTIYEKKICLGIGLNIKVISYKKLDVTSQYDLISLQSIKNGTKTGVWGEPITHFLPLIINRNHIERNIHAFWSSFKIINNANMRGSKPNWYKPSYFDTQISKNKVLTAIDILIEMMNNIVVHLVMNEKGGKGKGVKMQLCEKALIGYCSFHHILLYLKKKYPIVKTMANKMVQLFLSKDGNHKSKTPDLGKLLIYTMLSKFQWPAIATKFTLEVFTRNVRWYTQKKTNLNTINFCKTRLNQTFKETSISRNLVLFQIWFMKNCYRITLQDYNNRLGRPSISMRNLLHNETKTILSIKTWKQYFNRTNIIISKNKDITKALHYFLQWTVYNSSILYYHTLPFKVTKSMIKPKIAYYDSTSPGSSFDFDTIDDQIQFSEEGEGKSNKIVIGRGSVIKRASFRGGKSSSIRGGSNKNNPWSNKSRGTRGRGRGRGRGRQNGRGY